MVGLMTYGTRLLAAVVMGVCATFACAAASNVPDAKSTEVFPLTSSTVPSPVSSDGGDDKGPGCPHGSLVDPHRGFVRCLNPGEKSPFSPTGDADGGAPDGGGDSDGGDSDGGAPGDGGVPDGGGGDAKPPEPKKPDPPPIVEMKSPKFQNGDVPKAEKSLSSKRVLGAVAKCVAEAGGLTGKSGSLKVEILVRLRGKAEGVEVTPKGVTSEAAKCVRTYLKNRTVGTPTADPVGITVEYTLKPSAK